MNEEGHATDLITQEAIDWIKKQNKKNNSWFCYLPFTAVHTPVRAPEKWVDKYWDKQYDLDPEKIPLDGKNISPVINREKNGPEKREIYWNLNHNRFALRYGNWKLIKRENREAKLFNIKDNPLEEERRNKASENKEMVNKLLERLDQNKKLDDRFCRDDLS
ncbi:MAG: sulfatase-like hydrolase/transferase [Bacillota bacterium]